MPLQETDYCIEQINVPPKLPMILKQFCKSAIRTQPYDLLKWSSAYFRALANGEEPPAKLRLEYPPSSSPFGLTLGFLKVLFRQLGADYNKVISLDCVMEKWDYFCLDRKDAETIINIGNFRSKCQVKKFLSIAVGLITKSINETMIMICELFTYEPDGGSAMIPLNLFMEIYGYLGGMRCDGAEISSTEELCLCSIATRSSLDNAESARSVSEASQDTEADVELELDPVDKEDVPSAMTLQSFGEETEESFRHEGEASYVSNENTGSIVSKRLENEEEKCKDANFNADTVSGVTKKSTDNSDSSRCTGRGDDLESRCHPSVPGIGRRLLADEIGNVAIWMSDCARRQGGMVGPRNIRHINCPPLGGCCCPKAEC